ncbi:hypothetical protein KY339_01750 [Candidatus Woesearchaeota archaeon]|nr:hypothetical protein [Candidatus Woesearchaeota archaeon]
MACYAIPTIAAIVHYISRKKIPTWKKSTHHSWLNLLFAGGAIFGVVDHLWNGELFAVTIADMMLGLTITAAIFIAWAGIVAVDKAKIKQTTKA